MLGQGSIIGQAGASGGFLGFVKAPNPSGANQGPTQQSLGYVQSGAAQLSGQPTALLFLVAIEALALVLLRRGFRHSHGG